MLDLRCTPPLGAILAGALLAGGRAPPVSPGPAASPDPFAAPLLSLAIRAGPRDARLFSAAGLMAARVCRRLFIVPESAKAASQPALAPLPVRLQAAVLLRFVWP